MNFTSSTFIFYYLPISIVLYLLINKLSKKAGKILLLALSFIFVYWANKESLFFILITCLYTYIFGILIYKYRSKIILFISISIPILVLLFYKYRHLFVSLINILFKKNIELTYIETPLGISFVCFSVISYFVYVYKNKKVENVFDTSIFLTFFPKVISGPIVKYNEFKEEFDSRNSSFENIVCGIERIIIGLAKKVIIADTLGIVVSNINSNMYNVSNMTLWGALLCYGIEIYFDFSGYSDIAIGLFKMFGLNIKENFNYPYKASSISDFWRRWHISLGDFLKEYVYIPLGGNRNNVYFNLFIIMFISGLWHGNGIGYIIWGILNGIAMIVDRKYLQNKNVVIKRILTILFIYFMWIFFMSPSLSDAIQYLKLMFIGTNKTIYFKTAYYFNLRVITILLIGIIGSQIDLLTFINKQKDNLVFNIVKYVVLLCLFIISILFMVNGTYSPFIYFKF